MCTCERERESVCMREGEREACMCVLADTHRP